MVTVNNIP